MVASDAGNYRNLEQCGWRPGEMTAFFWGGNDKLYAMSRVEFELRQFARRQYQFDPFLSGEEDMAIWARTFARINRASFWGTPHYRAFCPVSGEQRTDDRRNQRCIHDG